jgi:hypothetical protein
VCPRENRASREASTLLRVYVPAAGFPNFGGLTRLLVAHLFKELLQPVRELLLDAERCWSFSPTPFATSRLVGESIWSLSVVIIPAMTTSINS